MAVAVAVVVVVLLLVGSPAVLMIRLSASKATPSGCY
jgi:hypothetical protein